MRVSSVLAAPIAAILALTLACKVLINVLDCKMDDPDEKYQVLLNPKV